MRYLPSVARWSLIINSIYTIINSDMYKINYRDGDSKEKIMQKIVQGSIYAEGYFNKKSSTEYNWVTEIKENKDYNKYVTEINKNWENISGELSCFSRLPLYHS